MALMNIIIKNIMYEGKWFDIINFTLKDSCCSKWHKHSYKQL